MKIIDAKEITKPLCVYLFICSIYTAVVITLISLAGKIFIEAPSLPLVYWVTHYIKKIEDIDIYDKNIKL